MNESYNYDNILLTPKYSILESRAQADTSVQFGPRKFDLPIVPANMKSIINEDLAIWLATTNHFYVMHRFGIDNIAFCKKMKELKLYSSISLGVNEDSYQTLEALIEQNICPDYITIDIAHGHSVKMDIFLDYLNEARFRFPWFTPFVIGGNVCTPDGVIYLQNKGCQAVKVGIANGAVCMTRFKTGFGHPQFSTVLDCAKVAQVPIIADGSIKHHGDIAKALVAGADMVMAGGIFAGHIDSPGELIEIADEEGKISFGKEYFGSASAENKGEHKNVEGKKIIVPAKGYLRTTYKELKEDLQSSISYAGGKDLSAFNMVLWTVVK